MRVYESTMLSYSGYDTRLCVYGSVYLPTRFNYFMHVLYYCDQNVPMILHSSVWFRKFNKFRRLMWRPRNTQIGFHFVFYRTATDNNDDSREETVPALRCRTLYLSNFYLAETRLLEKLSLLRNAQGRPYYGNI